MGTHIKALFSASVIVTTYILHYLWVFSSILWTSKLAFFLIFHILLFIFLFIFFYKKKRNLIICIIFGIVLGVISNFLAAELSYLITMPEKFGMLLTSIEWNSIKKIINFFVLFPTITGSWIVSLIFSLTLYKNN